MSSSVVLVGPAVRHGAFDVVRLVDSCDGVSRRQPVALLRGRLPGPQLCDQLWACATAVELLKQPVTSRIFCSEVALWTHMSAWHGFQSRFWRHALLQTVLVTDFNSVIRERLSHWHVQPWTSDSSSVWQLRGMDSFDAGNEDRSAFTRATSPAVLQLWRRTA